MDPASAASGSGSSGAGGWGPLLDASGGGGGGSSSSKALSIQSTETPALASPYLDPYSVGCWYRLGDEAGDYRGEDGVGGMDGGMDGPDHAMEVVGAGGEPPQPQQGALLRQGQQQQQGRLWPCQRSLHAAAVLGDTMYIFGGALVLWCCC